MIRQRLSVRIPSSLDEATTLLENDPGDTSILAGGTWVVPQLVSGRRTATTIVDLRGFELDVIASTDSGLSIGATATYTAVRDSPLVQAASPLLARMAAGITGGAQIRNQGTIGGSACYAFPSSDVPGVLVALEARLRTARSAGMREIDAMDFFRGAFATELRPDELLTAILVPPSPAGARFGYYKLKLNQSSWPIVTASCRIDYDGAVCTGSRIVLGGVAAAPVVLPDVLAGAEDPTERMDAVSYAAGATVEEYWSDVLADGGYRREVAGVVAHRALAIALGTVNRS